MNAWKFLGGSLVAVFALVGTTGCELSACDDEEELAAAEGSDDDSVSVCGESLTKFKGTEETKKANWLPGGVVTVDSIHGGIKVARGAEEGIVSVDIRPFATRGHSKDAEAVADIENELAKTVTQGDAQGDVLVKIERTKATVGADITVNLPPEFDGALAVNKRAGSGFQGGNLNVEFVGQASSVNVNAEKGFCNVDAGSAPQVDIECDNSIEALVRGVPAGASGGSMGSAFDIDATFPASDIFFVQARAESSVDVTNAESAGCTVEPNEADPERSVTVLCGGATSADPGFNLVGAGSLSDVTLRFQ